MSVKFILLLFVFDFSNAGISKRDDPPPNRPCPVKTDFKALVKYQGEAGLKSCINQTSRSNSSKVELDWACLRKCQLENQGFFDQQGKYIPAGVRDHFKKFTNATAKYVVAVGKEYDDCYQNSYTKFTEEKKNGTVFAKCGFYSMFDNCAHKASYWIQDC